MKKAMEKNAGKTGSKAVNSLVWLLIGFMVLLTLLGFGIFFSGNWLFFNNRHFTVQVLDLQEKGPGYWGGKNAEIAARAGIRPGRDNLWKLKPGVIRSKILQIPSIASCEVRRVLPDTLRITISERIPRAAIENPRSPRVLADDGTVLNRYESLQIPGILPVLSGFGFRKTPAPGTRCPQAEPALKMLNECLQNFPDISILYVNIAAPEKLDCTLRYRNRRVYRAILPVGPHYGYLLSALQSAIIDVLRNNDHRTTFDLSYRGQVVIR